jgi:hypothetical protein
MNLWKRAKLWWRCRFGRPLPAVDWRDVPLDSEPWRNLAYDGSSPLWRELERRGWGYASAAGAYDPRGRYVIDGPHIGEAARMVVEGRRSLPRAVDWLETCRRRTTDLRSEDGSQ